jgi:hypothetical protein
MSIEATLALRSVPDDEVLRRLSELVSRSRRIEGDLIAHIGEVDRRRLFSRQAFPSMFAYCTQSLHLSEAEAYRRITVARAARRHPVVLEMLQDGRLHLSGLARLAPLLTADNCDELLRRATHLSTRQIEQLVAELSPRPDVPATIRKLPAAAAAAAPELVPRRVGTPTAVSEVVSRGVDTPTVAASPASIPLPTLSEHPVVEALSPARYKIQFTASAVLRDKIERLAALMRSEVPDGDLALIIERAVTEKLERLEARRFGKTPARRQALADADSSGASRHIPAAVRRAVHERDGSRCRFVDAQGRRCSERSRLEFHHRHPFAMGGDHSLANVAILCHEHNRALAEHDYGQSAIQRRIAARTREPASLPSR